MANPTEMPRQQEKGPQGVSVEAHDPKGSCPWDPGATSSYSSLLCRDGCKAPRGSTFCKRQTAKPQESVIPSCTAKKEPAHFRSGTLGLMPDSGQVKQQEGSRGKRCSLSQPQRLAVPGTQPQHE